MPYIIQSSVIGKITAVAANRSHFGCRAISMDGSHVNMHDLTARMIIGSLEIICKPRFRGHPVSEQILHQRAM